MKIKLYHGSPTHGLRKLVPIAFTGAKGTSDGDRTYFRDVVFMTTSLEAARRYAGKSGAVYEVEAPDVRNYKEAYAKEGHGNAARLRRKLNKIGDDIFIANHAFVIGVV